MIVQCMCVPFKKQNKYTNYSISPIIFDHIDIASLTIALTSAQPARQGHPPVVPAPAPHNHMQAEPPALTWL